MLTSIDVKFIFDSARLGSALQIFSNSRVVFLLFLPCCLAIISLSSYSWNEWNVRHFCFYKQNNSSLSPGARFSKVPVTLRAQNQIFKSKYKE